MRVSVHYELCYIYIAAAGLYFGGGGARGTWTIVRSFEIEAECAIGVCSVRQGRPVYMLKGRVIGAKLLCLESLKSVN